MERTSVRLGGIQLNSSIMNASGARSAERGEIYELCARHAGALVFKSCNQKGLEAPENLKNRGVEHFAAIARELTKRGKVVIGSVVGTTDDEIVTVARALDSAGVQVIELNLADPFVLDAVAPFASHERLRELLRQMRENVQATLAVKIPPQLDRGDAATYAGLLQSEGIAIAVCQNDLPEDLVIDPASAVVDGPRRPLSQTHAFYMESGGALDIVAVGGVDSGREAYVAHLTGAKAVQVGSALMKEGAGALGRIDSELNALLEENGKRSVQEIIGKLAFRAE